MSIKPPANARFYLLGFLVYLSICAGAFGLGRIIRDEVLHSCPATATSAFTIYHPRHALTTGP